MSSSRQRVPHTVALGLRAQKGAAVVVGVMLAQGEPCVVVSTSLETHANDDPLSFEPYRVAAGMPRDAQGKATAEAVAAVAEGRRRQDHVASSGLRALLDDLHAQGVTPVVAALLVNRAGWITDLLDYSLAWTEHVPVAETLAVRDALRVACGRCGVELIELDEKSLTERASTTFGLSIEDIAGRLKTMGVAVGRPWRKEQKLACLAAWLAASGLR